MAMLTRYYLQTTARLEKAEYKLEFENRKFRLVRGTDSKLDTLDTILQDWKTEELPAYETVLRLCDRWSWLYRTGVACIPGGGIGVPEGTELTDLPNLGGATRGPRGPVVSPDRVLKIQNDTQRLALGLRNEAMCAASPFFRFLNYWKMLELPCPPNNSGGEDHAKRWIDQLRETSPSKVDVPSEITAELSRRSLGQYLWDECRNAIVHVTKPSTLKPISGKDRLKIDKALAVIVQLAEHYLWSELHIGNQLGAVRIVKSSHRKTPMLRKQTKT